MADRVPYNDKYCKEVNCPLRSGKKCADTHCHRNGNLKRAIYYTVYGHLADVQAEVTNMSSGLSVLHGDGSWEGAIEWEI